ncbi:PqqD family peptide modification chaperone [Streptomyces cuspidosporus]|uniref:Coenzyme PQQ synthesis protein D (PqqD) n=1 Tax=Streptomyces cuspidosporus TaxID=66882 RepID=A0ABP5TDI9_9ACTN
MWQLREGAHAILADDGGAILDEHSGRWSHLTPTASAAVMLLLAGTAEHHAVEQYANRYGISTVQAAADVRAVADALTAQGLAVTETASASARRPWWRRWGR